MLDALHEVLVPGVGEKTADALDIVAGMVSGTGRSLPNEHSGSLILQRAVAEEMPAWPAKNVAKTSTARTSDPRSFIDHFYQLPG
jgi:hypothetical protein